MGYVNSLEGKPIDFFLLGLSMLIFGWSSMVDSGRSFSTSLKTNHFSVTQVTVLAPWTKLSLELLAWLSWAGVGWVDSIDIRFYFVLKIGPWRKISHYDASEISESMIFCCHRIKVGQFFLPHLTYHNPKSFILDHRDAFCFFSLSTLSTFPFRVFFGFGGIPDIYSPVSFF